MAVPPSILPLNYSVSVTGDCQNTSSGVISVIASGGTPPYSYYWDAPALLPCILINTPCVKSGLNSGNYAVRINDSTVPINNEFIVNIPVSDGVCASILQVNDTTCGENNGSVTGTSTSDYSTDTFLLVDSNDNILQSATTNVDTVVFTNLSAGTYNLIVQDLGGCSGRTSTFVVQSSTTLDYGFYIVPNSDCGSPFPQGKIYVTGQTGNPPYSYTWSNTNVNNNFITGLTAGQYSVTVTDSNGCSLTKSATVTDIEPIGFGSFSAITPTCFAADGSLILTITGGTPPYYYSASTGNVQISYSNKFTLSNIAAGVYNFAVTDAGLCRLFVSTSLTSPQSIATVTVDTFNSTCSSNDGSIRISVSQGTAPFIYTLIKPDSSTVTQSTNQPIQLFSNLVTGEYTIFVTDQTGCAYNQTVFLIAENSFVISTTITGTTCNANNGTVQVQKSSGGLPPFNYTLGSQNYLATSLSAVTFSNVAAGQHLLTVSDSSGCTQTQSVYVPTSSIMNFTLYPENCGTGNQGTLTAFITSGTPPFTYNWSNNVVGNPQQIKVSGLTAGTYDLTVIDSKGCSLKRTQTISCTPKYVSYQTYLMGSEDLIVDSQTDCGIQQMLFDGYLDLITNETGCTLNSTIFTAKVSVEPMGISTSNVFYTGTSLNDYPADNTWFNVVKSLLQTIPGVGLVTVDSLTNQLYIQTNPSNPILLNQKIIIELIINYDIDCL